MRRWLFNIVAAVSLLLLLATAGLWVRSYWYEDGLYRAALSVYSQQGAVAFEWIVVPGADPVPLKTPWKWESYSLGPVRENWTESLGGRRWSVLGIEGGQGALGPTGIAFATKYLLIPYWVFCLAESLLPAAWLGRLAWNIRRHRHRLKQGRCPKCGYDLRAHHPGDKCPECATPVPPRPPPPTTDN
jgi:hypothetical protein